MVAYILIIFSEITLVARVESFVSPLSSSKVHYFTIQYNDECVVVVKTGSTAIGLTSCLAGKLALLNRFIHVAFSFMNTENKKQGQQ